MPRLIDISPLITEEIAVWPGDVPYRRQSGLSIEHGDNLDLSFIRTTVHLGAHADAPSHYVEGGAGIAERALEFYYGACQVMKVAAAPGARLLPDDLGPIRAPRLLLATGSLPDPRNFSEDFNSLSPELVDHAHEAGVVLLGIDTPSVDPHDDETLASHHALARHDMANLEGLVLDAVEPGLYTLIALPLKLDGADASPVRAALLTE
jgi:arylformamidase